MIIRSKKIRKEDIFFKIFLILSRNFHFLFLFDNLNFANFEVKVTNIYSTYSLVLKPSLETISNNCFLNSKISITAKSYYTDKLINTI